MVHVSFFNVSMATVAMETTRFAVYAFSCFIFVIETFQNNKVLYGPQKMRKKNLGAEID